MSFGSKLPKISQLIALHSVARFGSFTAAAENLHVSQSSLTRSIQELESVVGTLLIIRGKRGSQLTKSGFAFAKTASLLLENLSRAVNDVSSDQEGTDLLLRFGVSPISAHSITNRALGYFMKEFPQCRFHVDDNPMERHVEQLRNGYLDFAIGNLDSGVSLTDFVIEPLMECPFYICCAKTSPYADARSLTELHSAQWWITGEHRVVERMNLEFCQFNSRKSISTRSFIVGISMVLNYGYCALLSSVQINKYRNQLKILDIPNLNIKGRYGIVRMKNVPLSAPAERLISDMHYVAEHYDWSVMDDKN